MISVCGLFATNNLDHGVNDFLGPDLNLRIQIGGSYTTSDRFLVDASYFAIKNITLGYTIPKQWLKKAGLESVRIFGSVDNLALFSHLDGMDPQYNFKGETDYSYAPNKTYSVGFEINF